MNRYRYLFGPVPSRRFGRSLGVDLSVMKTCTIDCIFCQLGRTTHRTRERRAYVPIEAVKQELLAWKKERGAADYLTLSGSGEPTLHSGFGDVLAFMKEQFPIPTVLLSNGTLFYLPEVREAASRADVVKLSLSAWDAVSFERMNRPHEGLCFERCLEGMRTFRKEYAGRIWLEVFFVEGLNDAEADAERIARLAETIQPDEIQLNTAVRPPAEAGVRPVGRETLERIARRFRPEGIVIGAACMSADYAFQLHRDTVLDMLRRRPCTARQVAEGFGMHVNEVAKYIGELMRERSIQSECREGDVYYFVR